MHTAADIYDLTAEQLITLDKFKEKSVSNLLAAIAASRRNGLDKLLFALGIRNIGSKGAALLAEHFVTMEAVQAATEEEINAIDGFGGVMTESVLDFFAKDGTQDLVRRLREAASICATTAEKDRPSGGQNAGGYRHAAHAFPHAGGSAHHTERRQGVVVRL